MCCISLIYFFRVNVANGTGQDGLDVVWILPRSNDKISDFDSEVTTVEATGKSRKKLANIDQFR